MVRFHCLFCHGFEYRGSASAEVLAVGEVANVRVALHLARMAKRLAKKLIVYMNEAEDFYEQILRAMKNGEIEVDKRRIVRLELGGSEKARVNVHLEDQSKIQEGFLVLFGNP